MTTIRDLPEETLLLIFKQTGPRVCQKVCRSWYRSAHTLLLNEIDLDGGYDIDKFISSIDSNPNPGYLKAVKKIRFPILFLGEGDPSPPGYKLDKTKIQKLLLRFPNLKEVDFGCFSTFFEEFNDEICLELLKSCPQLETFETNDFSHDNVDFYTLLLNIRLLLTSLSVRSINSMPGFDTLQQYITNFPHLKSLETVKIPINTMREFLPVFTELPFLTAFTILHAGTEQDRFAETYMASKSQDEQDKLVKRLSELKNMRWSMTNTFCLNAIKFFAKYLTGLSNLSIHACLDKKRTSMPQRLFFHAALDLITSVDESNLYLKMRPQVLQEFYPVLIQKIFGHPTTQKRILRLSIERNEGSPELATLETGRQPELNERTIYVTFREYYSLLQIAQYLSTPLDDIDEFRLEIDERRRVTVAECNIHTLDMLFEKLQSVKEMWLELPASFVDIEAVYETVYEQAQLEKLTIHAVEDMTIQSLLDRLSVAYPRLKDLSIFYNCGTWKQNLGEYQLELGKYTLDSLAVDVTPVSEKTKNNISEKFSEEGFFVVHIECLVNSQQYLYMVSFDDLKTTKVLGDELKQYTRGKDYMRLHITATSLKQVKFCRYIYLPDETEDYMRVPEQREVYTVNLE